MIDCVKKISQGDVVVFSDGRKMTASKYSPCQCTILYTEHFHRLHSDQVTSTPYYIEGNDVVIKIVKATK